MMFLHQHLQHSQALHVTSILVYNDKNDYCVLTSFF